MKVRKATNFIVIHCSATRSNQHVTISDIRHWHVVERGWSDIGYHWVIDRNGQVLPGRKAHLQGAHVRGHNHESVGVCLIGGIDDNGLPENNFTQEQMLSLEMLVESLGIRYPGAKVVGHNFFNPYKACPCFMVEDWLEDIQ